VQDLVDGFLQKNICLIARFNATKMEFLSGFEEEWYADFRGYFCKDTTDQSALMDDEVSFYVRQNCICSSLEFCLERGLVQ